MDASGASPVKTRKTLLIFGKRGMIVRNGVPDNVVAYAGESRTAVRDALALGLFQVHQEGSTCQIQQNQTLEENDAASGMKHRYLPIVIC